MRRSPRRHSNTAHVCPIRHGVPADVLVSGDTVRSMRENSNQIGLLQTLAFPVDLSNLKILGKDNGIQDDTRLESEGHASASLDSEHRGGRTNACANNLFNAQESASHQAL